MRRATRAERPWIDAGKLAMVEAARVAGRS
jgi:hypothetical protein